MAGWAGRGAGQGVAPLAPPPESLASGAPAQQTNDTRYEQHYSWSEIDQQSAHFAALDFLFTSLFKTSRYNKRLSLCANNIAYFNF